MKQLFRIIIISVCLIFIWQMIVFLTNVPSYILPGPLSVGVAIIERYELLARHGVVTLIEIIAGMILGTLFGFFSALSMAYYKSFRHWLMPVLVISQAIPVFALAPVLVLWLGYGMESKIAMATLIIYFPVTATFLDGLRRTPPGWIDIARTMSASPWAILRYVRIPSALPHAASGLRVAAAIAPIGAIVGEWVGSSSGLGYLMLHANARMQIDVMFAALFILALIGISLYFTIDLMVRRLLPWQTEDYSDTFST